MESQWMVGWCEQTEAWTASLWLYVGEWLEKDKEEKQGLQAATRLVQEENDYGMDPDG